MGCQSGATLYIICPWHKILRVRIPHSLAQVAIQTTTTVTDTNIAASTPTITVKRRKTYRICSVYVDVVLTYCVLTRNNFFVLSSLTLMYIHDLHVIRRYVQQFCTHNLHTVDYDVQLEQKD